MQLYVFRISISWVCVCNASLDGMKSSAYTCADPSTQSSGSKFSYCSLLIAATLYLAAASPGNCTPAELHVPQFLIWRLRAFETLPRAMAMSRSHGHGHGPWTWPWPLAMAMFMAMAKAMAMAMASGHGHGHGHGHDHKVSARDIPTRGHPSGPLILVLPQHSRRSKVLGKYTRPRPAL